jgi:hypothetical protein
MQLGGTGAIGRVALIKSASVSHSWNTEQRFIELTFQQNGDQLNIQAPTRAGDAPPGFYLLFVLNSAGTPTIAKIAKIGVAANPNPAVTPSLLNPGNQSGQAGTAVSVQLSATDPNGDSLTYSASGLPSGVSINPTTGEIGGTPTASGTFNVVVTASDGVNSDSESFAWAIAAGPPFVLNTPPPPAPAVAGSTVSFTASVTGGAGLQFQWDFDDGTPATAFSSSATITHQFAQAGIYYVMLTARDSSGATQVTTYVLRVHYPLTPNRPAISGNIAFEDRATGVDRVWVVNRDHNSVSAFNAHQRQARDHHRGHRPAAWPSGRAAKSGSRTSRAPRSASSMPQEPPRSAAIKLPFASQPFGIVSDPTATRFMSRSKDWAAS